MTKTYFENQIFNWLNNPEVRPSLDIGNNLINVAFHHLIRWHPQVSHEGFDTYKLNCIEKLRNWEISDRAIIAVTERLAQINAPCRLKMLNDVFFELTHPEHNVSVNLKKRQLLNLDNPNLENVRSCLNDDYQVILLSKEESQTLNGRPMKQYMLDGQYQSGKGLSTKGSYTERLEVIGATIADIQTKDELIRHLTELSI